MKRGKIAPHPAPASPAAPTATTQFPADATSSAAARQADPPSPDQAGTEAAVAAWRNEGDPN